MAARNPRKRYLIITTPRSGSNLLVRMLLSQQPRVSHTQYTITLDAIELKRTFSDVDFNSLDDATRRAAHDKLAAMATQLERNFDDAEAADKIGTDKEHAIFINQPEWYYSCHQPNWTIMNGAATTEGAPVPVVPRNATIFTDALLESVTPIFLIRHPALSIPSYGRIGTNTEKLTQCALSHTRTLYEWYKANTSREPIILDASDFMAYPYVLQSLAEFMGLDPDKVIYEWPAATDEERAEQRHVEKVMMVSLSGSTAVLREKIAVGDLDDMAKKWIEEFGEEKGRRIERLVRSEMGEYEYLWSKRYIPDKKVETVS